MADIIMLTDEQSAQIEKAGQSYAVLAAEYERMKGLPGAVELRIVMVPSDEEHSYTHARALILTEFPELPGVPFASGRGGPVEFLPGEIARGIAHLLDDATALGVAPEWKQKA